VAPPQVAVDGDDQKFNALPVQWHLDQEELYPDHGVMRP